MEITSTKLKAPFVLAVLAAIQWSVVSAQNDYVSLVKTCDSVVAKTILGGLTPGAVLAIVRSDSVLFLQGYGQANIQNNTPVDAHKTLFQLGSVGKVLTAIAVLQLVEQGKLDLDADVNTYLTGWKIQNPFSAPVTLRRLLTHSAGFDERLIGYMARNNASIEPLEHHLSRRMPEVYRQPGSEINYSNYSYGLAGLLVEKASGMRFDEYVSKNIFLPLGMSHSTYRLPDPDDDRGDYAQGYRTRDEFVPTPAHPRHVTPAGSISSTGSDIAALMQALLRRDSSLGRGVLYESISRRQFSAHPLLTGYTIGLEEQRVNGHFAVSKGGTAPGFLTNMLLFPEQNLGLFITINTQTDNALDSLFAAFKAVFPSREAVSLPTFAGTINTGAFAGIYRNNRCSHSTIEEMFQLFQSPVTIRDGGGGALEMILNGELYRYLPVNDSVFQQDGSLGQVIVFSNFREGKPRSLYTTVEINGLQLPTSFERLRWYERPRFVNDEFPAVFLVLGIYLLLPLYWLFRWVVRRRKPGWLNFKHLRKMTHLPALAFVAATAAHLLGFLLPLAQRREELLFGLPPSLKAVKYLTWLMAVLAGILVVQTVRIWRQKEGWAGVRLYYTLFALAAVAYVLFLWRWHFMSMAT